MKRHQDWPERLSDFYAQRRHQPFVWGRQDCCLFACDAVLAMTSVDLAADFRGKYDSARSAFSTMKAYAGVGATLGSPWEGGASPAPTTAQGGAPDASRPAPTAAGVAEVAEIVAGKFGLEEVPARFAQRGDIVLARVDGNEVLGIVSLNGTEIWVTGAEQIEELPLLPCLRAWRIG